MTQSCGQNNYTQLDKLAGRVGGRQLEDCKQSCRQGVILVVWLNSFREEMSEKKCGQGLRQADILELS